MLTKALAWSSLVLAFVFAALSIPAAFDWFGLFGTGPSPEKVHERIELARKLFLFGGLPALAISLLAATALLFVSAFQSKD
jgi:hypothetical protein